MSAMTESGVIAARCGGRAPPTKSWLIPENEIPTMPGLPPCTHGCAATVSTTS
jgi:hypothetical protein